VLLCREPRRKLDGSQSWPNHRTKLTADGSSPVYLGRDHETNAKVHAGFTEWHECNLVDTTTACYGWQNTTFRGYLSV
jgi:hypothetical protein